MQEPEMLSEKQKRDFCAFLLRVYGIRIDPENELLPVYYLAYTSSDVAAQQIKKATSSIQEIATNFETLLQEKLLKNHPKQYLFSTTSQAFWHGFGKWGVSIVVMSILLFAGWTIHTFIQRQDQHADQIKFLLEKAKVKEQIINDTTSVDILTLFPANSLKESIAGENYVYRQDCKCIEIPLSFRPKGKK